MTNEENNETTARHRVASTARRVKRAVTAPLHRRPRPSLPTPAAAAFVGPDGRSYWLVGRGEHVAVLIDEPGMRPEVFDIDVSIDQEARLQATTCRAGESEPTLPAELATEAQDEPDDIAAHDAA